MKMNQLSGRFSGRLFGRLSESKAASTFVIFFCLCLALTSCRSQPTVTSTPANDFVKAAAKGNEKAVSEALDKGMPVNTVNAIGTTAAMAAAARGQIGVLKILANHGANLATTDEAGDNVWSFSITEHQIKSVQFLVSQKLDPNLPVYKDLSPLFIAVLQKQPEIVGELLKAGAKADFVTDSGGPLHTALRLGDIVSARLLIDAKAPLNRQDPEGETPLMIAAGNGMNDVVSLLLKRGAKKDLKDKTGRTAKNRALFFGHIDTASLLD